MLEAQSPLFQSTPVTTDGVSLSEVPGLILTQVAGENAALTKALGKIPTTVGRSMERGGQTFMRIAPRQVWVLGGKVQPASGVFLTPLSSGRSCFLLEGPRAREILASLAAIDFHPSAFKAHDFVMTGVHHLPVLIHCVDDNTFHIYVLRSFAQDMWEWIADAMKA